MDSVMSCIVGWRFIVQIQRIIGSSWVLVEIESQEIINDDNDVDKVENGGVAFRVPYFVCTTLCFRQATSFL